MFQSFWDYQNGKIDESIWKSRFASGKCSAQQALASGDTPALLGVLFNRLYTLRNQLIHGGATWSGSVNREQMRDCTSLLSKLVPLVIELMMDSADTLWGMRVIRWWISPTRIRPAAPCNGRRCYRDSIKCSEFRVYSLCFDPPCLESLLARAAFIQIVLQLLSAVSEQQVVGKELFFEALGVHEI